MILVLTAGLLLLMLCGCGTGKKTENQSYTSLEDLEDKRIGVTTGSVQAIQAEERFPDAEICYYTTGVDCLGAMRAGKIDAFADAEALLKFMMAENPDLTVIEEKLADGMQIAAAFPKTERGRKLCDQYSEFLRNIKQNGVYDEIQSIWYGPDESLRVVPDLDKLPGPILLLSRAARSFPSGFPLISSQLYST